MHSHPNTALLVFSRFLKKETEEKIVHSDREKNFEILQNFENLLSKKVKQSGLHAFHFDESKQRGQNFGEKLSNALEEVFEDGFESVIVIGNDCPDLSVKDIHLATQRLNFNDLVLGPDLRGGAYLIGITRSAFNKNAFEKLSWQSGFLIDSFKAYAGKSAYTLAWLEKKADFNTSNDISIHWSISRQLRKILDLTDQVQFLPRNTFNFHFHIPCAAVSRRGPPLAA